MSHLGSTDTPTVSNLTPASAISSTNVTELGRIVEHNVASPGSAQSAQTASSAQGATEVGHPVVAPSSTATPSATACTRTKTEFKSTPSPSFAIDKVDDAASAAVATPPPTIQEPEAPHARSSSLSRSNGPTSIPMPSIPPVPALEHPDTNWDTNSLALLLPHQALFAPEALQLLRDAFASYGTLAHWAPVRGMGRVIIVYNDDRAAELAKKEGDGLALHVDLDEPQPIEAKGEDDKEYFGHQRKRSQSGVVLRVYALPRTPLDAPKDHLRPPETERNFLISPPGSPPEGWEPIAEDGPNMSPLADDLRRALESLQLNGSNRHRGGPEVILDEGGVRVEVEDADRKPDPGDTDEQGEERWYASAEHEWGEEEVQSGPGIWTVPTQEDEPQSPLVFNGGGGFQGLEGAFGSFTPAGQPGRGPLTPSGRIMPTARPPMPSS